MPQFNTIDRKNQKINPAEKKEVKVVEKHDFDVGMKYSGKKEGETRSILRIIYPIFTETKHSTIIKKNHETGEYQYNTPDAYGHVCRVNFENQNGEHESCSPSEFVKWMSRDEPVAVEEKHGPGYIAKIDEPTMNFIANQAKANKGRKIMAEINAEPED